MRTRKCILPVALVLSALAVPTASAGTQLEPPTVASFGGGGTISARTTVLDSAPRRLADLSWWGGTYTVASGETVTVYVSRSYPEVDAVGRQWAEFFAALPHGPELGLLKAYVAPLEEVWDMCGSWFVIGCYGGSTLVTVGDSSAGEPPAGVAAHEYGHHIAANRRNDPWPAIDWGTKRWATAMHVCERVANGTAFPGDEDANYSFNPGEAFAESYRVLIATNGTGVGSDWPIVDPSFRPDATALAALREDVVHPWLGTTSTTIAARFAGKSRTWSKTLATPLDGVVKIGITVPGGGADDMRLLSSNGGTVLSTATWNSSAGKSLEYKICGARSVKVRVTRGGSPARFTLRVARP
jgi:hypothetical protein